VAEKPIYDRAVFWAAFGGVVVVLGGTVVGIGLAQVGASGDLWNNGWFKGGIGVVGAGAIAEWWALTLYLAHRHAERLGGRFNQMVVYPESPAPPRPFPVARERLPEPNPLAPKEVIELDLAALLSAWADLTTAQVRQYLATNLRGKWAIVSGRARDVWSEPPAVSFGLDVPGADVTKTHLNVMLRFRPAHAASLMLLKQGASVRAQGQVTGLVYNQFRVPQLVLEHCDLLKGDADETTP
jgi:hypothetical protein